MGRSQVIKRIYHDYRRWEDYKAGMWDRVYNKYDELLSVAIKFTGNHIKYGCAMIRVVKEWRYCCEHNLTNKSINRKAWIGHAACCLELGLPEYIVRDAWKLLTNEQRILANNQAGLAIKTWESNFTNKKTGQLELFNDSKNQLLDKDVGAKVL